MISVEHLSMEFGARPLFEDVSFVINKKDRVALVGKNGAGKSTLLKILSGQLHPTSGKVVIQNGVSIGYLPQVMILSDEHTVIEETEHAFSHVGQLQKKIDHLKEQLEQRNDYESADYMSLVEEFTHESERFQMIGGLNYRARMERTLQGLGFEPADFNRPTKEFSGGWRMRIELAKLLLQCPDILLLDEPTNHLDIESIRWLETFLMHSNSAIVLVSHDRTFINNVTNRTIEITCGHIVVYKVKYDDYVRLREERREQQLRAYENQQREIADIKDFIERFRYKPTKAVQVQSRIKQLEKMVPIEVDEVDNAALRLKFPPCTRSGDYPLICEDVSKSYGSHCIFHDVNLTIKRGDKVAFVGKNGEGKSTFVKCIMGQIPFRGSLKLGHNVEIGYYAQNQAQLLDGEQTVFDTIDRVAKGDMRLKIRDLLGAFMFGGEMSDKKVKVLSGGERSRLAMLQLLLEPFNFLILDEPTNHLDMRTKDILKEAISAFDGTVIIVSHDRDFLDGLVTKVYEFGGGLVREHIGGIFDFLQHKNMESLDELRSNKMDSSSKVNSKCITEKVTSIGGKLSYEERKARAKQVRKAERFVEEKEKLVCELEKRKADIETRMAVGDQSSELLEEYNTLTQQLTDAENEWEKAMEILEAIDVEK